MEFSDSHFCSQNVERLVALLPKKGETPNPGRRIRKSMIVRRWIPE